MTENSSAGSRTHALHQDALDAVLRRWSENIALHKPEEVASLFTEDAVFQGSDPTYGVGRGAVAAYYGKRPSGLRADYRVREIRPLGEEGLVAYVDVDFVQPEGRTDRTHLTLVLVRRDRWYIEQYHVSAVVDSAGRIHDGHLARPHRAPEQPATAAMAEELSPSTDERTRTLYVAHEPQDLPVLFSFLYDSADFDSLADLFVPDATWFPQDGRREERGCIIAVLRELRRQGVHIELKPHDLHLDDRDAVLLSRATVSGAASAVPAHSSAIGLARQTNDGSWKYVTADPRIIASISRA